jgi:flagellar assembly protein FliH
MSGDGAQTAYQRFELPHLLTANQMEHIQKQAHEEGFARGLADGQKAAQQEMQQKLQSLGTILGSLSAPLKELDDRIEEELVTLAMMAARLIVRREIKTDPGQVMAAVREAIAALPAASRQVRVHLHPDDAAIVREHLMAGDEQAWKLVDDPLLARGGCQVLTDTSVIDASVEARLTAIMAATLGGERSDDRG